MLPGQEESGAQKGSLLVARAFSGGSDSKEFACNTGNPGSIPGFGRSPGGGNGYPLQYSCLLADGTCLLP